MFKEIEKKGHGYIAHNRDKYETVIYFDPGSTPLDEAEIAEISSEIYEGSGGRLLCIVDSASYGIIRLLTNAAISFEPEIGIDEEDAIKMITNKISTLTV